MRRPPVVLAAAAALLAAAEDVARFYTALLAGVLLLNGHGPTTEARGDEAIAALSCGGASAASSRPETHAA